MLTLDIILDIIITLISNPTVADAGCRQYNPGCSQVYNFICNSSLECNGLTSVYQFRTIYCKNEAIFQLTQRCSQKLVWISPCLMHIFHSAVNIFSYTDRSTSNIIDLSRACVVHITIFCTAAAHSHLILNPVFYLALMSSTVISCW